MILAAEDLGDLIDLAVLLSLPGVLVLAWLVGRLLGVRRSWTTTLLSGVIGWIGGVALSLAIASQRNEPDTGFTRNVWLFSTLGVMSASVWIELLAKPGTFARAQTGLTSIRHPIQAVKRRGRRVSRYAQITRIAIRNGLGPSLGLGRHSEDGEARQVPFARRLRHSLEECGGMFVKMGQVASTRSDLVSPAVADELSHLQDHVAPAPSDGLRELLEDELDAPVDEVFAEFDWNPLAAASIGQAHRARLHGGQQVIVKVQRPGIANSVNRDLDVLDELAGMVEQRTTWGAEYRVSDLADEFAERLPEELDFEIEARNASDIAANLAGDGSDVRIPGVYYDLTTRRVLVMEWLDGVSVRETDAIDELGVDRRELAEELLRSMMQQMLVDAQYHADPHPGNVMVLRDGRLSLSDFGAASRIDLLQQSAIREIMLGVAQRDADVLRQAVLQVATLRRDVDDEDLERALSRFMTRHLAPGMVPSAAMFNDLLQLFFTFGINLPPGAEHLLPGADHAGRDPHDAVTRLPRHRPGGGDRGRVDARAPRTGESRGARPRGAHPHGATAPPPPSAPRPDGQPDRARQPPCPRQPVFRSTRRARRHQARQPHGARACRRGGRRDRRNADQRARWTAVRGSDVAVRVLRVLRSVL
jgi:ubiquinone biosynthesis protein